MAKITLSDIANLENQSTAVASINANSDLIEAAIEKTLSRDGTSPNTMEISLDMNSHRIINLVDPVSNQEPVTLAFGTANYGDSLTNANNAEASEDAAASSATAASASQTSATTSATAAAASATASAASATASAASATLAQAAAAVNISGMTNHGVMTATGTNSGTSTAAMTNGQMLVGQTGADPLPKTLTGDVTIASSGATTVAAIAGVTVTGTTGTVANVFSTSPTLVTPTIGAATATSINKMAITAPASSSTLAVADGKTFTVSNSITMAGTDSTTMTFPAISTNVGFRELPQNSQSAAYTTILTDNGKHIYHPSADTTARVWTIDSNANVAYPIGTTLTFINDTSGGVITIAITSDTLILAGAGTTGSRTLAANGIAVATKMTSTRWIISGTGLT